LSRTIEELTISYTSALRVIRAAFRLGWWWGRLGLFGRFGGLFGRLGCRFGRRFSRLRRLLRRRLGLLHRRLHAGRLLRLRLQGV
jgi:hypothetical protein